MRNGLIVIALLAIHIVVKAQQDPQFSQNMHNHMTVNPGFAGERGNWAVSGAYRNQWQKMDGAPETYVLNVDAPLRLGRIDGGVGLNVMSDKLGMQSHLHFMVNYAYKKIFNFGILSAGIKIGVVNSKIAGDFHIPVGPGFVAAEQDPALGASNIDLSEILFDAGAGVFLSGKKYYAGVSVNHLTKPKMRIGEIGEFFWNRHMYLTAGYTVSLTPKADIQPSVFFKTDFISSQYSVNANFVYDKKYWGGVSYRYEEALTFMGGIELKNGLLVGYSYDWNISDTGRYTGDSHEVTLSYCFGMHIGKRERIYKSVRFL